MYTGCCRIYKHNFCHPKVLLDKLCDEQHYLVEVLYLRPLRHAGIDNQNRCKVSIHYRQLISKNVHVLYSTILTAQSHLVAVQTFFRQVYLTLVQGAHNDENMHDIDIYEITFQFCKRILGQGVLVVRANTTPF